MSQARIFGFPYVVKAACFSVGEDPTLDWNVSFVIPVYGSPQKRVSKYSLRETWGGMLKGRKFCEVCPALKGLPVQIGQEARISKNSSPKLGLGGPYWELFEAVDREYCSRD